MPEHAEQLSIEPLSSAPDAPRAVPHATPMLSSPMLAGPTTGLRVPALASPSISPSVAAPVSASPPADSARHGLLTAVPITPDILGSSDMPGLELDALPLAEPAAMPQSHGGGRSPAAAPATVSASPAAAAAAPSRSRSSGMGVTGRGVVVLIVVVTAIVGVVEIAAGGHRGHAFGVAFVITSALGALVVRRKDLAIAMIAPPLLYCLLLVLLSVVDSSGTTGGILTREGFYLANGFVTGAPAIWIGSGAAALIGAYRIRRSRSRRPTSAYPTAANARLANPAPASTAPVNPAAAKPAPAKPAPVSSAPTP